MSAMPEFPPYIYGNETGPTEKVVTLQSAIEYGELCRNKALEEAVNLAKACGDLTLAMMIRSLK